MFWQVRLEPSSTGVANRVVVGYKNAAMDPVTDPSRKTVLFRNSWKPEQTLVGVMWPDDTSGMPRQDYHWIVKNSGHWFYRGTGLSNGSVIRFAVGNEVDRRLAAYPGPTATEYVLLAQSPYIARDGSSGIHEATMYRAPSGAHVFGAGTLNWMRMIGGITGSEPTAKLATAK